MKSTEKYYRALKDGAFGIPCKKGDIFYGTEYNVYIQNPEDHWNEGHIKNCWMMPLETNDDIEVLENYIPIQEIQYEVY